MSKSRTTNTIYNFTSSIGGQLLTIIMQFVVRTVFISTLGKSYLGINGLFSNVLSMLSLAELGVGSAILYKLYEPIANDDQSRIASLMHFYKIAYRIIGIVVMIVGICLIPFLPLLIKDYDTLGNLNVNAVFVFCVYLFRSISSYLFFAYKSAIIKANQKEYLVNLVSYIFILASSILQIICLVVFSKFEIYIFILVVEVIGQNIVCAILANKLYPYINEKNYIEIGKEERKQIFKDCGALFIYKMNAVVVKAADNIVLSIFLGLEAVAYYSNYYVFYTTIRTLFSKIFNAVSHSIGNLHASQDKEHEYKIFEAVMLITAILGGTSFVGIFVCADEFVDMWIGSAWTLAYPFSLLMGLELFTAAFKFALSKYRTTMGLFQQAKFRPLAGMIINVVVSVALVDGWGICGVLVGTIASDWLTFMWFDPLVIHKEGFGRFSLVYRYYAKFIKYFVVSCLVGFVDLFISKHFLVGYGWISVIIHAGICALTVPGALIAVSIRTEEGRYVLTLILHEFAKLKKKVI